MYPVLSVHSLIPHLKEHAARVPDGVGHQEVLDAVTYTNTDLGIR